MLHKHSKECEIKFLKICPVLLFIVAPGHQGDGPPADPRPSLYKSYLQLQAQQELFTIESENTVETLSSVHAFYDIEEIFGFGRRSQKLCTNCMLNLCKYDIYGIKLLSVKSYISHSI
jgi:hypothetical protein